MKSTGYFLLDRKAARAEQKLNASILRHVISEDERLSEVTVGSTVRGLSKSHQIARTSSAVFSSEASAFRVAHLDRVGNRAQESRDKRKAFKEARRNRAFAEGRIALSY